MTRWVIGRSCLFAVCYFFRYFADVTRVSAPSDEHLTCWCWSLVFCLKKKKKNGFLTSTYQTVFIAILHWPFASWSHINSMPFYYSFVPSSYFSKFNFLLRDWHMINICQSILALPNILWYIKENISNYPINYYTILAFANRHGLIEWTSINMWIIKKKRIKVAMYYYVCLCFSFFFFFCLKIGITWAFVSVPLNGPYTMHHVASSMCKLLGDLLAIVRACDSALCVICCQRPSQMLCWAHVKADFLIYAN